MILYLEVNTDIPDLCVPYIANLKDCDITKKEEQQQR